MIDLRLVASIYWSKPLGQKLKQLRGSRSVREIAQKASTPKEKVSFQYIHMLEDPERYESASSTVSTKKLELILNALDSTLDSFLTTSAKIFLDPLDSLV